MSGFYTAPLLAAFQCSQVHVAPLVGQLVFEGVGSSAALAAQAAPLVFIYPPSQANVVVRQQVRLWGGLASAEALHRPQYVTYVRPFQEVHVVFIDRDIRDLRISLPHFNSHHAIRIVLHYAEGFEKAWFSLPSGIFRQIEGATNQVPATFAQARGLYGSYFDSQFAAWLQAQSILTEPAGSTPAELSMSPGERFHWNGSTSEVDLIATGGSSVEVRTLLHLDLAMSFYGSVDNYTALPVAFVGQLAALLGVAPARVVLVAVDAEYATSWEAPTVLGESRRLDTDVLLHNGTVSYDKQASDPSLRVGG